VAEWIRLASIRAELRHAMRHLQRLAVLLASSGAHPLAEVFRWSNGLDRRVNEAKAFYLLIAPATLAGALLSATPIEHPSTCCSGGGAERGDLGAVDGRAELVGNAGECHWNVGDRPVAALARVACYRDHGRGRGAMALA
jgi:hypothetical protein